MHTSRGETQKERGGFVFLSTLALEDISPGSKQGIHTTHMKHGQDLRAAVQEGEEGGEGEHVRMLGLSRRCLTLQNKKEGSAYQGIPIPAVHAAQDDRKHWADLVRAQSEA